MKSIPPLATVVTVTYNSAKYVSDAIESTLCSSYRNFELIIGDDASTDDSWKIISGFNDRRIKAYRNESNLGEYFNRNKAIGLATGEYLIFIDGDDMLYPHGLEFMIKMLHAFPDCAMALMLPFRNDVFYPAVITPRQFYIGEYFGKGFMGTAFSNILFRTKILKDEGGLSEHYHSGDDYIRYKIAIRHQSVLINDDLTWWRETPGQASSLLRGSVLHTIESYVMKFEFLNNNDCPLTSIERTEAKLNLNRILARIILKSLMKGKFFSCLKLLRAFKVPFKYFTTAFMKPVAKEPLVGYSASRPYRLPFAQNPFCEGLQNP
jgi:glycosyltransferase involved in cell wall biosynthesis